MIQRIVSIFLLLALTALLLVGCSGSNNAVSSGSSVKNTGQAMLTINWPQLSRLIPVATNSISITITDGGNFSTAQTINRPTNVPPTSTVTFSPLPPGNLTVTASGYPLPNAVGVAQTTGTAPLIITAGQVAALTLTMNSTITQVVVTPSTPAISIAGAIQLSATPKNSANSIVLVAPGNITWSSVNPAWLP